MDEIFAGGTDSSGRVVKRDDTVIRPAGRQSFSVHRFLRHLRKRGFSGAPTPVNISDEGEVLSFVPGNVPEPPYESWYYSEEVLAGLGRLIRSFHDAAAGFDYSLDDIWNEDLVDISEKHYRSVVCHNDIGPGNVVFADRRPVAIIDFDYAAPGRPLWDVARSARNWIPLDDPLSAETYGMSGLDSFRRLRVFIDSYGLTKAERSELPGLIAIANSRTELFVRNQVSAGREAFVRMWEDLKLEILYEKRRLWLEQNRVEIVRALS